MSSIVVKGEFNNYIYVDSFVEPLANGLNFYWQLLNTCICTICKIHIWLKLAVEIVTPNAFVFSGG